jgi:hypothetical protein
MRKFLLWIATMWVGMVTVVVVLSTFIGASTEPASALAGSVVLWLFSLGGGLLLSAPAFVNPPDDNGAVWSFRLPLPLWMFLIMLKLMSWVGFYVLLGTWMLIFKVWHTHQNNKLPTFSNGAQQQPFAQQPFATQPYGAQPFAPQPYGAQPFATQPYGAQPFAAQPYGTQQGFNASLTPAGWQADPTGRNQQRWWDGMRWTDQVLNNTVQATDPL